MAMGQGQIIPLGSKDKVYEGQIGLVSKIDKIWLYCVCMSLVTENIFFNVCVSYLGICDVINITYPTRHFIEFINRPI